MSDRVEQVAGTDLHLADGVVLFRMPSGLELEETGTKVGQGLLLTAGAVLGGVIYRSKVRKGPL